MIVIGALDEHLMPPDCWSLVVYGASIVHLTKIPPHTHTYTHARTHARTNTHARTHARTSRACVRMQETSVYACNSACISNHHRFTCFYCIQSVVHSRQGAAKAYLHTNKTQVMTPRVLCNHERGKLRREAKSIMRQCDCNAEA